MTRGGYLTEPDVRPDALNRIIHTREARSCLGWRIAGGLPDRAIQLAAKTRFAARIPRFYKAINIELLHVTLVSYERPARSADTRSTSACSPARLDAYR